MSYGPSRQVAGAGRLERPKACASTCFRDRPLIRPDHSPTEGLGAPGGIRTHGLVPTEDALCLAELQGQASRRHDSNVRPPPSEGGALVLLSYGQLASTAGVEPAPSGFVDRRLDPFGHVDPNSPADRAAAPSTGLAPATSDLTGRCYHSLSYDGLVRALGLEPRLVRGKSPVPYQSGVARPDSFLVGREGIEPPVSERRLVYSQLHPMARPTQLGARRLWPQQAMPMRLSKC